MKVLFLYPYAILGGCTTQLANRVALTDEGIEPHFGFAEDHGGTKAFGDYPHIVCGMNGKRLAAYMQTHSFEAVAVLDSRRMFEWIDKIEFDGKLVGEVHSTYTHTLEYLMDDELLERMDALLTPSRYLANAIHMLNPSIRRKHVEVIANCSDTTLFKPRSMISDSSRPLVIWVGKIDNHKNWLGFLHAAGRLLEDGVDAEFWMIGGETADDTNASKLLGAISQFNLSSHVRWIPRLEYDRMPYLYSMAATRGGCMLITSRGESFCMAALEAMLCGCPVVAPDHTALPELLQKGELGALYRAESTSDAAIQVHRVMTDKDARKAYIDKTLEDMPNRYGTSRIISQYAAFLRSLVAA